jgi:hypothetical protein
MQGIKDNKINVIFNCFFLLFFVFSCSQSLQAVPVIPNEGIIEGEVVSYCIISSSILNIKPAQKLYRLRIKVTASKDVKGKQNLTKNKVGKTIEVYSKKKIPEDIFKKTINARIVYRGDERGGLYWIKAISILNKEGKP